MKKIIILGILLGILMAGNVVRAQGAGDKYILDSLRTLLAARTIESDIRIETFVDGREYIARGYYAEQALPRAAPHSFLRSVYRLDIHFAMNSSMPHHSEPNCLTLVCHASEDGAIHQIQQYTFIEGVPFYRTIDLKKLEERVKASNRRNFFSQVSEVRNLGGLAGMMRQISHFYEFSLLTHENLHDEEPIPVLKLTGTLRSDHIERLLPHFGGLNKKGEYPSDFPSDIEVWLGRHDDFPYKICYLRRITENSERKELLFQKSFYKVVLNGSPPPDSKFAPLTPPEGIFQAVDDTEDVIRSLGL